ncbi:MAG TPA: hypothetical protein VGT03_02005 [Candidatus Acidoferrales bacterium]|nr:hypothetical protein [Candidatus Acidoferrales bacterium]
MSAGNSKPFFGGARLVWRRQRILWWIFAVNLILAFSSIHGMIVNSGAVLDNSLASDRLVHGFDLSALGELGQQPGISPIDVSATSFGYGLVFFVFMLFITGGLLDVYRRDTKLTTAEFFEACGSFFWRFARLLIFLLLCLIPIALLRSLFRSLGGKIEEAAVSPMASIWFRVTGGVIVLFLLMVLRLWFDIAEVHSVAQNERKVRRALAAAARITLGNFGRAFWLYLRISVIAWVGFCLGLWLWMFVLRPEAITTALLLSQLMILWWIGARLWQRASETLWYQQNAPVPAPVPAPSPVYTASVIETQTLAEDI